MSRPQTTYSGGYIMINIIINIINSIIVVLWMGRTYFITSKFSGYDMSWSLLLTTISRLCTTWSSSRASCAVVISYWLPHFQPPSYSREAIPTICFVLYYSFFQRFCKYFNVLSNYNRC